MQEKIILIRRQWATKLEWLCKKSKSSSHKIYQYVILSKVPNDISNKLSICNEVVFCSKLEAMTSTGTFSIFKTNQLAKFGEIYLIRFSFSFYQIFNILILFEPRKSWIPKQSWILK